MEDNSASNGCNRCSSGCALATPAWACDDAVAHNTAMSTVMPSGCCIFLKFYGGKTIACQCDHGDCNANDKESGLFKTAGLRGMVIVLKGPVLTLEHPKTVADAGGLQQCAGLQARLLMLRVGALVAQSLSML